MIALVKNKVRFFLNFGHERSLKLKRNIIYTFLIRGTSFLIGLVLVPLTIHYVNPLQYGVWITISSLVAWMSTFDIGLSNGLRNNLAHSLAIDEKTYLVKYVSTTYALLSLIALGIFIAFAAVGSFFNWNQLLNIENVIGFNIWPVMLIALGAFCIQFSLQPISSILIATHQPFKSSLISLFGQMLTLAVIYILTFNTKGNLFTLVIVVAGSPVLIFLLANIYLFKTNLAAFAPKFSSIDFTVAKKLLNIGVVFFFIQVGALILYETDNIVLTTVLGPGAVTTFNVGFKYFSLLTVAFSIIITPFWSAFTDAYAKNDMEWIRVSLKKMRRFWVFFSILALVLFFFADTFYGLWVGKTVPVSQALSFSLAIFVIVASWQGLHSYVLNGTGKLRVQLILLIITSIINIPLSVFLVRRLGVPGTVIANIVVMVIMNIVFTYQAELIISRKAKGIWNK